MSILAQPIGPRNGLATRREVIDLDMSVPFTAARARNAGFRRLREMVTDLAYVQFVDGDCELIDGLARDARALS